MARRAVVALSAVVVSLGMVCSSSATASPPAGDAGAQAVQVGAAPPSPPKINRGKGVERRATPQELRRADKLADETLQTQAQPIQTIQATTQQSTREARVVQLSGNGAWTWYSDPRVLETSGATYFAYVTRGGSVMLTSVEKPDGRMRTTVLRKFQLRDDHNVPALVETPDGRVVAFWGGHGQAPVQYRVTGPGGDITKMSALRRLKGSGMENSATTYVQAFRMRGVTNQYHVLTRRYWDQNWVLTTSKDLVNWTKPIQLFKNSGQEARTWPYLEAASSGWRRIHLAVTDAHPAQEPNNSLYHFTYDADTTKLRRTDGQWVTKPAFPRSGTRIYDGRSVDGRVRVYDFALRSDGNPAVAFTTQDRDPTSPGYTYKWATSWGGTFTTRTVARQEEYPEGISLDHADGNTAYVVTRAGQDTQLSELRTSNGGYSWRSRAIALQKGVQRTPTAPAGVDGPYSVMWLTGTYTSYTDYATTIVGESTGPAPITLSATWPSNWAWGGGVSGKVRIGSAGPNLPGIEVSLLVKKPGERQRYIKSATTDQWGNVRMTIDRSYPKGTTVALVALPQGQWGLGRSSTRRK